MAVLAKLPALDQSRVDPVALANRLEEQLLAAEVQGSMLDVLTAAQPFEDEVLKTMAVFRKNVEDDRRLLQTVIEENKSVKAQLTVSERRYEEAEKMHAAEKQELMQLIREQSVLINELNAGLLTLNGKMTELKGRFDRHQHAIGTLGAMKTCYSEPPNV